MEVEYKTCPGCKERKPATAFYLKRNGRPSTKCMACMKSDREALYYRTKEENLAKGLTVKGTERKNTTPKEPPSGTNSPPNAPGSGCAHYYVLGSGRETSWGICIYCSNIKEFRNYMTGGEWHSAPERQLLN